MEPSASWSPMTTLFRDGLRGLLATRDGVNVVGKAASSRSASMESTPLSTGCCRPRNARQPPARLPARVTPRSGEPLLCTLAASERPRAGVISGPFALLR
jgi:hypothetical protein